MQQQWQELVVTRRTKDVHDRGNDDVPSIYGTRDTAQHRQCISPLMCFFFSQGNETTDNNWADMKKVMDDVPVTIRTTTKQDSNKEKFRK